MIELPPNEVLREMLTTRRTKDRGGASYDVHSAISDEYAVALYRQVLKRRPKTIVEIGMAYGVATLAMLTALEEVGGDGKVISIDPYTTEYEMDRALYNVERAGLSHRHTHIRKPSHVASPELLAQGMHIEFAYIDGWHSFDFAFIDFFYVDQLLAVGGVVGFNDCGWPAVHKVLKFIKTHRKYTPCDVGLKPVYTGRNPFVTLLRFMLRQSREDQYFLKQEHWTPPADYYRSF